MSWGEWGQDGCPEGAVPDVLFANGLRWVGASEYEHDDKSARLKQEAKNQAEFADRARAIRRRYEAAAVGEVFQGPSDAIEAFANTLDARAYGLHHWGVARSDNAVHLQEAHVYAMKVNIISETQWEALQMAKASPFNKEHWLDNTSLEEFLEPAIRVIQESNETISSAMDTRRIKAAAEAPLPDNNGDADPNIDVPTPNRARVSDRQSNTRIGTGSILSYSPMRAESTLSSGTTPSGSDDSTNSLGDIPAQGSSDQGSPLAAASPSSLESAAPVSGSAGAAGSPAGLVSPVSAKPGASTSAMSAGGPVSSAMSLGAKSAMVPGLAPQSLMPPPVVGGVGSVAQPGSSALGLPQRPASVNAASPPAASQAQSAQNAGAGGGGNAGVRSGVPGAANAQSAARAAATTPAASSESVKQEPVATAATRAGQAFRERYGVIDGTDHPNLVAATGALRLLARQSVDALGEARVAKFGVAWVYFVLEYEDREPVFLWTGSGLAGGPGYLHRGLFIDLTASNAHQGGNPYRLPAWVAACVDPLAAAVLVYKTIAQDAESRGESVPRLACVVTTRSAPSSEEVRRELAATGAQLVVDAPDAGKMEAVVVPPFLAHRIHQLDPALSWVVRLNGLSRDKALAFALALAQDAIDHCKDLGDTHNEAQAVVDALARGEKPPWDALLEHYGGGDGKGGRLQAAYTNMVDSDPETDEDRAAYMFADEATRTIIRNTRPDVQHAKTWRQAVLDALVLHLGRLDNPAEQVGTVLGDLAYEYYHVTASRSRLDQQLANLPKGE